MMRNDKGSTVHAHPGADQHLGNEQPREAALIAVLATIIERVCVIEQPRAMVQSDLSTEAAKTA
jgi:hypothetical protein